MVEFWRAEQIPGLSTEKKIRQDITGAAALPAQSDGLDTYIQPIRNRI